MTPEHAVRLIFVTMLCAGLGACGGVRSGDGQSVGYGRSEPAQRETRIQDLFISNENPSTTVGVNRYLWNASLEVLNFLPVQAVDPYTGVIQTGYGTPPGGGRSYRATIQIADPALDARSLRLSLQGPGGAAVEPGTVRAVEDAILTRARQLRLRDGRL